MSPRVFDCAIAPRLRDLNLGMHVDNVEAVRVLDEARHRWVRFAAMDDGATGLYGRDFASLAEMVVGHRIEYRAELRVDLEQPYAVRLWTTRVGRTSLTLAAELRSEPGGEAAVVAETTVVLWDRDAGAAWPFDDAARTRMQPYLGDSIAFRG